MSTFIREFNFWPRFNLLDTWYSADTWQSINDVTYWHEKELGRGTSPALPANYMTGIIVPFTGFVGEINAWIVPDNNKNSHSEVSLFKYSLLNPSNIERVSSPIEVLGSSSPFYIQKTSMVNSTVTKGDCLLLCARELDTKKATPHIFGNIVMVDW